MSNFRQDAGETLFLARELEFIVPEVKEALYRELRSQDLIPVATGAGAGTKTITWRSATKYGRAKIITAYGASDLPKVGRSMSENTVKVHSVGSSASWSRQEVRESAQAGKSLDRELMLMMGEANARTIDQGTLLGDVDHNIPAFLAYPGLTQATIPNDGAGTLKTWASKTGTQILRDAGNLIKAVTVTTKGIEKPNTLLLPLSVYIDISVRPFDAANSSNKTILAYLQDNLRALGITSIEGIPELETIGAGGTGRAYIYTKDPRKVQQHIPLVFDATPAQPDGLEWKTAGESRFAGATYYYILSAAYGDGV